METYTKEQLIEAMTQYNKNFKEKPENFTEFSDDFELDAKQQVEYLLSLIK